MKHITSSLFIVLMISSGAFAQKLKYGHMNGETVFQKMPEVAVADSALMHFVSQFETEIGKMNEEYTSKIKDYQETEATMNDLIKKSKAEQINALNEKIKKFQIEAQKAVNDKRAELYSPIVEKFNAALKSVASKNGYQFIIDNSKGVLLYYNEADDVSKLVEKELGIK